MILQLKLSSKCLYCWFILSYRFVRKTWTQQSDCSSAKIFSIFSLFEYKFPIFPHIPGFLATMGLHRSPLFYPLLLLKYK
jgi:hypothetical protein